MRTSAGDSAWLQVISLSAMTGTAFCPAIIPKHFPSEQLKEENKGGNQLTQVHQKNDRQNGAHVA